MNPAKAWALLGARGAGLEITSPGYSSIGQSDVAGMLAHWPAGPFLMGMVRYAGDDGSRRALEAELTRNVTELALFEGWPGGALRVPLLVHLALLEKLHGARCRECGGAGYLTRRDGSARHCAVCDGKRVRRMTETERASLVGMSERNWRRGWSGRYESVYSIADKWDDECISRMRRELRNNGV